MNVHDMEVAARRDEVETEAFDAAEFLDTPEAVSSYLSDAMAGDDPAHIAHAFGVAARARGMSELARQTGLQRQNLYRSLSESGNPTLSKLVAVSRALGVKLTTTPLNQ